MNDLITLLPLHVGFDRVVEDFEEVWHTISSFFLKFFFEVNLVRFI